MISPFRDSPISKTVQQKVNPFREIKAYFLIKNDHKPKYGLERKISTRSTLKTSELIEYGIFYTHFFRILFIAKLGQNFKSSFVSQLI